MKINPVNNFFNINYTSLKKTKKHNEIPTNAILLSPPEDPKEVLKLSNGYLSASEKIYKNILDLDFQAFKFYRESNFIKNHAYQLNTEAEDWAKKGEKCGYSDILTKRGTTVSFEKIDYDAKHKNSILVMQEKDDNVVLKTVTVKNDNISEIIEFDPHTGISNKYEYYIGLFKKYSENISTIDDDSQTIDREFEYATDGKVSHVSLGKTIIDNNEMHTNQEFYFTRQNMCEYKSDVCSVSHSNAFYSSHAVRYSGHFGKWECEFDHKQLNRNAFTKRILTIKDGNLMQAEENVQNQSVDKYYRFNNGSLKVYANGVEYGYPVATAKYKMQFDEGALSLSSANCTSKRTDVGYF